jgi:hypothetical protein
VPPPEGSGRSLKQLSCTKPLDSTIRDITLEEHHIKWKRRHILSRYRPVEAAAAPPRRRRLARDAEKVRLKRALRGGTGALSGGPAGDATPDRGHITHESARKFDVDYE